MSAIGPGSAVECVDAVDDDPLCIFKRGATYIVETVVPASPFYECSDCGRSFDVITLEGVPIDAESNGWCIKHFRPIDRPWLAELLTTDTTVPAKQPVGV